MSLSLDLESVILFLFFIAPGFLFTRTYVAYRPRYYRPFDTFEQLILSIIGSVVIHATLFAGLGLGLLLYYFATGNIFLDFSGMFLSTMFLSAYPVPLLVAGIFLYIIYLVISLLLARRFATFLGRRTSEDLPLWWRVFMGKDPPEPFLLWHTILQVEPLKLNLIPPHVTIQMRNGEYFEGNLSSMRMVGDTDNTVELALRDVFHSNTPPDRLGEEETAAAEELDFLPNQVVLLKSTDILWLSRNDIPT